MAKSKTNQKNQPRESQKSVATKKVASSQSKAVSTAKPKAASKKGATPSVKAAKTKTATTKGSAKGSTGAKGTASQLKSSTRPVATKSTSKAAVNATTAKNRTAKGATATKGSKPPKSFANAPANSGKPTKKGDVANLAPASNKNPAPPASTPKMQPTKVKKSPVAPPPSDTNPDIVAKIRNAQASKEARKDLAQPAPKPSLVHNTPVPPIEKGTDRVILMVRDGYWLHAHWDITRQTVERARVSIAEHWHSAKPILRLLKLDDNGTTNNAETVYKDIEIHGGVRNWYIEVETPGCSYKVQLGYLNSNDRFYELVRSNTVTMPVAGAKEIVDDHWADIAKDAERIYSMSGGYNEDTQSGDLAEVFEERLKRTMETDVLSQFGAGAEGGLKRSKQFFFAVDAELLIFGSTHTDAHVNVGGEPVKVRPDGTFSIRLPLPDRRQVLPATAKSRDGVDEQTVVIAVERNTKVMEPLTLDIEDL